MRLGHLLSGRKARLCRAAVMGLFAGWMSFAGSIASAEGIVSYTDGDAKAGKVASAPCAACHGVDGNSASPSFPKLAGQNPRYLFKQLHDMKSGLRPVALMASLVGGMTDVSGMSEQTMADLAAYFAEQSPTLGTVDPELKALGESIYRGGIADRGVPACMSCHGPTGAGVPAAGFPALSGQHPQYTQAQLVAFRAAARGDDVGEEHYRRNDGDAMIMRSVVKTLTDDEIKALASYVSGLYGE